MRSKCPSLIHREAAWDMAHLLALVSILCWYPFFIVSPAHEVQIAHLIINPLAIALVSVAAFRYKGGFPWEVLPSFVFTLWFYCVYALNGDLYLLISDSDIRYIAILLAWIVFYGTPFFFKSRMREKVASALALVMVVSFGILAWIGLVGFFTGNPFKSPYTGVALGIAAASRVAISGRFTFFHLHPNVGAAMCMTALFCGIYLIARTHRKVLRTLYGLLILGIYLVTAPTDSRTVFLAVSAGMGLLAFLFCFRSRRFTAMGRKLLTGFGALVITTSLVFFSFSGVQSLMHQFHQTPAQGKNLFPGIATAIAADTSNAPATHTDDIPLAQRNLVKDFSSLGGRVQFFNALITLIQEKPSLLWKGTLQEIAMEDIARIMSVNDAYWKNHPVGHMHNSLLQTLLLTGVPGLLAVLCFLVLLLVQSLRLFFASPKTVPLSAQIWVILVWVLLLVSMVEAYLFTENNLMNLMFFFAAGMVISQAKESLPFRPRRRR